MRPIQEGHGQGAAGSHSSQNLRGSPQRGSAKRDESAGHGVGHAMQEPDQHMQNLQMEVMAQRTWWSATTRHHLLGNICLTEFGSLQAHTQ